MEEQEAIRLMKAGDISALGHLVESHQHKALRVAYLITQDAPLAQDVVQEAFVRAFRGIQRFTDGRPFQPWFMRIVARASVKASRRESRHLPLEDWIPREGVEGWLEEQLTADEHLEAVELQAKLAEAMQMLPPKQRAVLVLRYYLDLDEQEAGDALGAPVGTVKWRLHTARRRLRELLSERSAR